MRKKRFFSFIIALSIILSFAVPVCAEGENGEAEVFITNQRQSEALSVLRSLGFISEEYTEDVIAGFGDVTRARFAEFANRIYFFGIESDALFFYDVSGNHYAASHISSLVEYGIVSVDDDRMFRPDEFITPDEAAKIIVYSLGYKPVCEASEDRMATAKKFAFELDLFEGVSFAADRISFCDMLLMIYNSLLVEIPAEDDFGEHKVETFISKNYGIYVNKGRVDGADEISVFGEKVNKNEVLINGVKYQTGNLDLTSYLAKNIQFFYKDSDEKTVLWIKELNNNDELIIKKENFPEYNASERKIEYTINGKTKTAVLSDSAEIIYNGKHISTNSQNILSDDFYQMRLVRIKDSDYDVCFIDAYENYIVSSNQPENKLIYFKFKNVKTGKYEYKSFDLSKYDRVDIILPDKTKGEQKQIPDKAVISVFESDDKSRIRLECAISTVKGIISSVDETENHQRIYVDGTEYISSGRDLKFDFTPGSNINLMLDTYGYIADAELGAGAVKFGFMTSKTRDEDEKVYIKLFDASSGELVMMPCAEAVTVDAKRYKDEDKVYMAISSEAQLIAFSLNDKGEIKMIDMPEDETATTVRETDNMLVRKSTFASLEYSERARIFGPKIRVSGSTTFIGIPKNPSAGSDIKDFSVGTSTYFQNESYYNVESYDYGTEARKEFTDVILCNDAYFYSEYWVSTKFLVDKVSMVYDEEEGETVYQISGYHGSTYKTLKCSEATTENIKSGEYKVRKGDTISITNETGRIDDFSVLYGPSATSRPTSSFNLHAGRGTCFYPLEVVGTTVYGGVNSPEFEEIFTKGNATVFVYDSASDTISQGSFADIRTYDVYGSGCSTIYYYIVMGDVRNFIIYN